MGTTEALKEGKAWQGGDPERGFQKSWEWAQGWKPALEGAAPHPHPRVCPCSDPCLWAAGTGGGCLLGLYFATKLPLGARLHVQK